jgi:lantibiotic modifying enzyme
LQHEELYSEVLVEALKRIINVYRLNQNPIATNASYFPSWVKLENHQPFTSRLAWCYGDLGIGTELYRAGEALNDIELKEYALTILKHTVQRREVVKENVADGNFCHGSCGLSEVYRSIYQLTKEQLFLETADYWFNVTLDLAVHEDGIAGYKTYLGGKKIYEYNSSLLEGATGVGMVFMATLLQKELPWKKALML